MPLEMVDDDTGEVVSPEPFIEQRQTSSCTPALKVNFEVKVGCGNKSLGQYIQEIPAEVKFIVGAVAVLSIMKITKII